MYPVTTLDNEKAQTGVVDDVTRPVSVLVKLFQTMDDMFVLVEEEDVVLARMNVHVIGQVDPLYDPNVGAFAIELGVGV